MSPTIPGKSKQKRNSCCCGLVTIVGAALILTIVVITQVQNARAAAPFKGMQTQMKALCQQCSYLATGDAAPRRVGKVMVVDSSGAAIGRVLTKPALRGIVATAPAEVGSVLLVGDADRVQTGSYTDGAKAYRIYRDVCIIDRATGDVIYSGRIGGHSPPSSKSGGTSQTGSDPLTDEVVAFIAALTIIQEP